LQGWSLVDHGPLAFAGAAADFYGIAFGLLALRQASGRVDERGQAFSPWAAASFAAMLTAVLLASRTMNEWLGAAGVVATAAVAGLASVDPAAISVATLAGAGKITVTSAVFPILVALTANTITKAVLTMITGGLGFALRVLPGLAIVVMAAWTGWWLLPP
jgi:uncharacterized membrane protein (DUF4010 family)